MNPGEVIGPLCFMRPAPFMFLPPLGDGCSAVRCPVSPGAGLGVWHSIAS